MGCTQAKTKPRNQTTTNLCQNCNQKIPHKNYGVHVANCRKDLSAQECLTIIQENNPAESQQVPSSNLPQVEEKIPCAFCSYMQSFQELDTHPQFCLQRESQCSQCGEKFPLALMDQHKQSCHGQESDQSDQSSSLQPSQSLQPIQIPPLSRNQLRQGQNIIIRQPLDSPQLIYLGRLYLLLEMIQRIAGETGQQGLSKEQISNLPIKRYPKKEPEEELCTICYCKFVNNEEVVELQCKHLYHPQCVKKWLQINCLCPVCRLKVKV